ncbi:UNVERIFIED_CONTAM: hypothetical protein GTU68_007392 [Idotea baltica]|nr:hypothetical protein [Idotea baltica]
MTLEPNILGYIAAFCTTCAFIPQVIHTLRTKDTSGISLGMYSLFVLGVSFWLVYGVLLGERPIVIANIVTLCLSSTVLFIKIKNSFVGKATCEEESEV